MINIYHEIRKIEPSKARKLIRDVLESNNGNVSKTARILNISRHTVRRARDGPLEDISRRPKRTPNRIDQALESLVVEEAKRTGFRYRRLSSYIQRKYSIKISENTIKVILKRRQVKKKTKRSANGKRRHLYEYEHLIPFSQLQLDTKHLLDKKSLPENVYSHIKEKALPQYEYNIIDACTRARFTAYSYELNSTFGFMFIVLVGLHLRAHGVRTPITIRLDNGKEFCGGSEKKLRQWNEYLSPLCIKLDAIPPRATYLMGIIENSHRADDEYFLMIHAERCNNTAQFLYKAQRWQDTWNFYRPSYGIAMNGLTPYEKLKQKDAMLNKHILTFPVMLMETVFTKVGLFTKYFINKKGGKYVYTKCQND